MSGNKNDADIIIDCRNCDSRVHMSEDPEGITKFLMTFFSEEDRKVIQEKLLPGTVVSVPVCLSCFSEDVEVKGGITFSRIQ